MANFFKLAGYDYDAPRGSVTIRSEDDGIRLFVDVYANTKNEEIDYECRDVGIEQVNGIFLKVKSLQELVGRKLVWEDFENEYGDAGVLNVIECEWIRNAEFIIESINDGIMTVYWKGIGDICWSSPFNVNVPFETRVTIPLPDSAHSASIIDDSLNIYLEDGELKIQGTINLGYIGLFKNAQIEIEDSLEDIRKWNIVEEHLDPDCSENDLIDFLNTYYNKLVQKIEENIDNINGTFLLQVLTDMDNCETNFMVIDGLFDEDKLIYGNEEDIAEIYNPVRTGLHTLSAYLETPNDGSIPKGHIESVLRSFYPMFDFDCLIENIVSEYIRLGDREISFQCSDKFDCAILRGASAVLNEELTFLDWHNN